jgi:hypothetical protein
MGPPRMTIRRWMVIIAIGAAALALVIGALGMKRRQNYYSERAQTCASAERMWRGMAADLDDSARKSSRMLEVLEKLPYPAQSLPATRDAVRSFTEQRDSVLRKSARFARLKEKYEFASKHPWLPVELEPPIPEGQQTDPTHTSK